jgi:hypothetical protein
MQRKKEKKEKKKGGCKMFANFTAIWFSLNFEATD